MTTQDIENALHEVSIYIDMHRYEQALDKLKTILSYNPTHGRALYLTALCYTNTGYNDEALELCTESLQNGFSAEDCYYLMGSIYKDRNQFAKAEEHYLACLHINPLKASAISSYALLMLKTGHKKKAKKLIDEAMKIDPSNEIVLHNVFIYCIYSGNKKAQTDSLQKYVNNTSNDVWKLISIGTYNKHNKKYTLARENFREAFLLDPTNYDLLSLLEEMDILTHWFFFPYRLIQKAGGTGVVFLGFVLVIIIGCTFIPPALTKIIIWLFLLFNIYGYLTPFAYNTFKKYRRR